MKPYEMYKPEDTGNSKVKSEQKIYRIPGDETWEYVVDNGEWKTRKVGSKKLIAISTLPPEKRIEATLRLDDQFENARTDKEKESDREFIGSQLIDMDTEKIVGILKKVGRAS